MNAWGGVAWLVGGLVGGLLAVGCGDDGSPADGGDGPDPMTSGPATAGTDDGRTTGEITGADTADGESSGGNAAVRPNWHQDIAPLVVEHCGGCHVDGGIAPYPMEDYAQTSPLAPIMALQAEARLMPPWHAVETDECDPFAAFKHDARLSDEQVQLLRDWTDAGAPEGDPALAAPLPTPPALDLESPTVTVPMQSAVSVEPAGSTLDFFHCLSLDPGNTEDVFVDGMQVIAGNRRIVHHVLVYVDVNASSAGWPGGVSEDCGGGAGTSDAVLVGAWVPGGMPMETPQGVGIRMPAGARIILNMHYHALATGAEVDDATSLALRWQTSPPEYVSEFTLIGAPAEGDITTAPFLIPAGEAAHQEVVDYTVPFIGAADVRVFSILNHMHKVGVDMKASVIRGGEEICLVQTPGWDFNWQRLYEYDLPIDQAFKVQSGDVVRVRCTYDNTLENPALVEALGEVGLAEPQDVTLGEGTLDEMCIAGMGVAVRQ